jgi:hypothetical protein
MSYGSLNLGETFLNFIEELEKTFQDQNVKETVFLHLLGTQQGKTPLADFLQVFKLNIEEAGYQPGKAEHDVFVSNSGGPYCGWGQTPAICWRD